MLDIKGTNVKLWINQREGRNGTKWNSYSISVSKKDGSTYINKPVKVMLSKNIFVPENIKNGTMVDFEGFPSLDIYIGKDGQEHREIMIFAQSMQFKDADAYDHDDFAQAEEDIPFN